MDDTVPQTASLKYLSIRLDENGQKVIASFYPEGSTDAVTLERFKQAINEAGFGQYSLHESSIGNAAAKYNSGEVFEIIVGEALDGKFSLKADLMNAYLTCTLPRGGAPVQMQNILQEAEKRGITAKLDLEAIEKTLREGGDNVMIASGIPPVHGVDGKFENLIPGIKERSPHLDEHGLADFRDLGEIVTVHSGDQLMRRILPTSGDPGQTLTGKAIPAKPGKNVTFATKLDGVVIAPSDPNLLVSQVNGYPVLLKDGVKVEPVYAVKNVDLHTGNISFDGTVNVAGDILSGMTVKVTGDIHVEGTVEGALLDAGGDIVVKGGIIGGTEQYIRPGEKFHPLVKCNGSCTARFVQNAHISAGKGIFIHDIAMLSDLSAGHQIIVGDEGSRKGNVIGGVTRAAMLVKVQSLGSDDYVKTVVIAGADQALHERLNIITKARETAEKKFNDIIKILEMAGLKPDRVPPETVKTAETTRDALNSEIETLREDERELHRQIDLANGAQVVVEKRIFGGAEIHFGLKRYSTAEDREGGVFHLSDGELVFD